MKVQVLHEILSLNKASLKQALPKHLSIDRLIRIACAAAARDKKLLECSTSSLLKSVMQACQLGLEPGGALGGAYLLPFYDKQSNSSECTLVIGYRGLIDLARRSGNIAAIEAHVVYKNDNFEIAFGLEPVLKHTPTLNGEPGAPVGAYAIARFKEAGSYQYEFMTINQIEAVRARSRSANRGPWVTDYDEMVRKTVVKRLCKYLPLSVELAESIESDNRVEFGDGDSLDLSQEDEITQVVQISKTDAAKAKLKNRAEHHHAQNEHRPDAEAADTDILQNDQEIDYVQMDT